VSPQCGVTRLDHRANFSLPFVDGGIHVWVVFPDTAQSNAHIQALDNTINSLVNNGQIDPEEVQYLRDKVIAIKDRLEQHRSRE
jgi:hypothetical protein